MKKKIPVLAAVLLTAALLTGCSADSRGTLSGARSPEAVTVHVVELPDGASVMCAVYTTTNRGGITCDWDGVAR